MLIMTVVPWDSHGEYASSNHVMMLHINRCAFPSSPLPLLAMHQISKQDMISNDSGDVGPE